MLAVKTLVEQRVYLKFCVPNEISCAESLKSLQSKHEVKKINFDL